MNSVLSILIIDDNPDDRTLCKRALEKALSGNITILEAGSGESGLEAIAIHNPDCILLDYSLPGRNGIEVLKRIRSKHPHTPVVVLTGQGNEIVAVQVMKEGGQDYITKSDISAESLYRVTKIAIEHCHIHRRLEEQQTALSLFTRALAHDLKEPVRTIRSFLDLMSIDNALPEKEKGYLSRINNAANNMNNLIDTVFAYTRLSDEKELVKTGCDVKKIIEDVKINLNKQISEKSATIVYDTLPNVHAHETHLMQVFQNLVSNAIGHIDVAKPEIRIRARKRRNAYEFSVVDNGPGIAKEHWEEIFEPFKRLASSKKMGSGLGLAICKRIVERHGGKIWCRSIPGKGTAFHFTLPKEVVSVPTIPVKNTKAEARAPKQIHDGLLANVLLVDDNPTDIELTKILLMERDQLQFNLYTACNGKKAIDFLQTTSNPVINLILLDINMPEMDGFEFLRYRNEHLALKKCDVIMCSTSNFDEDMQKAKGLGAVGYIQKPATLENVKHVIPHARGLLLSENNNSHRLLQAVL